jgi:hypothetical protein
MIRLTANVNRKRLSHTGKASLQRSLAFQGGPADGGNIGD